MRTARGVASMPTSESSATASAKRIPRAGRPRLRVERDPDRERDARDQEQRDERRGGGGILQGEPLEGSAGPHQPLEVGAVERREQRGRLLGDLALAVAETRARSRGGERDAQRGDRRPGRASRRARD